MLDGKGNNDVDNEKQGDSSRKQEGKNYYFIHFKCSLSMHVFFDFVNVIHFKLDNCGCSYPWQANAY